jgi:hypothetical protein
MLPRNFRMPGAPMQVAQYCCVHAGQARAKLLQRRRLLSRISTLDPGMTIPGPAFAISIACS